jgi:diadenosine tetraphosphate (Ap4A) HIT family hydrolase
MKKNNCLICERIQRIQEGKNPYFVCELETGYVVMGDHQYFRGYSLFLGKIHKKELHELEPDFRRKFLWEMSEVATAVFRAFQPRKLNCELLGNTDSHLHWHIFPRHANDKKPAEAVWSIDKSVRENESARPSLVELGSLKEKLRDHLKHLAK